MPDLMRTLVRVGLWTVAGLMSCTSPSRPGIPAGSPFAAPEASVAAAFTEGVASGDVTSRSALLWLRTSGAATVQVEWQPQGEMQPAVGGPSRGAGQVLLHTDQETDFTESLPLDALLPGTRYEYHARIVNRGGSSDGSHETNTSVAGSFATAPQSQSHVPVTFVWSSDLGGQGHCRGPEGTYHIFDVMREVEPAFALLLGDLIYADEICPSPPNVPGSDFAASTLDEFRTKHRYQRHDPHLQRFLADVPVYATWDDHEVRNNFAGPDEPLMPVGRRALFEYWPIQRQQDDRHRLYRKVRYGADLELFVLDTRQYRSPNTERDGQEKTMLGRAQREWLVAGLTGSTATWKVIATSVPLSIRKGGVFPFGGNDNWARGWDGTGFQSELRMIIDALQARAVRNVVWLAGDVHYAQVNAYDPDGDGLVDFLECVSGPLSARSPGPKAPEPDLRPRTLFTDGGFSNFGVVTVQGSRLELKIIDDTGGVRYQHVFNSN